MDMVGYLNTAQESVASLRETRLGALRHPGEFLDWTRMSRPKDTGDFMKRAGYNVRYFSANYAVIVAFIAVCVLLSQPWLLFALVLLIGGCITISRFVTEPFEFQGRTITPQNLYLGLFLIGIPILFIFGAPFSAIFTLLGSSGLIIGAHAGCLEPGPESEYEGVETV